MGVHLKDDKRIFLPAKRAAYVAYNPNGSRLAVLNSPDEDYDKGVYIYETEKGSLTDHLRLRKDIPLSTNFNLGFLQYQNNNALLLGVTQCGEESESAAVVMKAAGPDTFCTTLAQFFEGAIRQVDSNKGGRVLTQNRDYHREETAFYLVDMHQ